MVDKKYVLAIDFILIVGSLFAVAWTVGYTQPLVIAPIDNYETSNTSVLFSFEKANLVLIDDNLDFTSPNEIYVKDDIVINLKPGTYYWKVMGIRESEIRTLKVESEISLSLKENNGFYDVINSGNTKLNVELYDKGNLVDRIVLGPGESSQSSGDYFFGRGDE